MAIVLQMGLPDVAEATQPRRVGILGDSLTAGKHTHPTTNPIGYAFLLRERLQETHEVFILGCGGTSTMAWRPPPFTLWKTCALVDPAMEPDPVFEGLLWNLFPWSGAGPRLDLLVVHLGTNDSNLKNNVSAKLFGERLRWISEYALDAKLAKRVYLVKPARRGELPQQDALIEAYGAEIDEIAAHNNRIVAGCDLSEALDPAPSLTEWPHETVANLLEPDIVAHAVPSMSAWGRTAIVALFAIAAAAPLRRGRLLPA